MNLRWLASFIQQTFIRNCICAWQGLDTEHRNKAVAPASKYPLVCAAVLGVGKTAQQVTVALR